MRRSNARDQKRGDEGETIAIRISIPGDAKEWLRQRPHPGVGEFEVRIPPLAMTFLQPSLLWLLPLAALPVVIHLLNRMRFRTVHWAATSFLFSANRASTRHARLRQLLLLACRVSALLAMILAVARPLAGGWAGWMLSTSPDVVLILMDRSASMEAKDAQTDVTHRQEALKQLAAAASAYGGPHALCALRECAPHAAGGCAARRCCRSSPALRPDGYRGGYARRSSMLRRTGWRITVLGLAEVWIASDLQSIELAARESPLAGDLRAGSRAAGNGAGAAAGAGWENRAECLGDAGERGAANACGPPSLNLTFDIQRSESNCGDDYRLPSCSIVFARTSIWRYPALSRGFIIPSFSIPLVNRVMAASSSRRTEMPAIIRHILFTPPRRLCASRS